MVVLAHSSVVPRSQCTFSSSSVGRGQARGGFERRGGSSLGRPKKVSLELQTPIALGSSQAKGKQGFWK